MNTFDTLSNELIVRRTLTVFIIIDTSRSMRGNKIRTVNEVMHDITSQMRDIGGCDAKVRIVALCFNDTCSWMTPAPVSIENFEWTDISAGGWTCFGVACSELNSKMSRNGFLESPSLSFAPVVVLLSDGVLIDE